MIVREYAKGQVLDVLRGCNGLSRADTLACNTTLKNYALELFHSGWSRFEIYKLMIDILRDHEAEISSDANDLLDGFITSLNGDVAPVCFTKFPGEPEDPEAFVDYVRGRKWMKEII